MNGKELAAAVGVRPNTLYDWRRSGYLTATRVDTDSGEAWSYTPGEVRVAHAMASLVLAGFSTRTAHAIARHDPAVLALLAEVLPTAPVIPVRPADTEHTELAVLDASDLSIAVRDVDPRALWHELETWALQSPYRLLAAVVALAAMVPDDRTASDLLAWTDDLTPTRARSAA